MATATTFKDRFYKLFAGDLTASTFVECLLLADEAEAEIQRLREHAVILASTAETVEREQCAKLCESPSHEDLAHKDTGSEWDSLACASAIRRRAA